MTVRLLKVLVVLCSIVPASCAVQETPRDHIDVLKELYASTVQILVSQPDGVRRTGSGVVLKVDRETGEAFVVTAGHVLTARKDIEVSVIGKFRKKTYAAKVLMHSDAEDVALLSVRGMSVAPVSAGGNSELGQDIWVISYPWGRRRTLVTGVVSQVDWPTETNAQGQVPLEGPVRLIDATVGYGTSGGGIFETEEGRLVGLVRGYRSVKIPLPGPDGKSVSLPVAGETTVISISRIAHVLAAAGFGHVMPPRMPGHGGTPGR